MEKNPVCPAEVGRGLFIKMYRDFESFLFLTTWLVTRLLLLLLAGINDQVPPATHANPFTIYARLQARAWANGQATDKLQLHCASPPPPPPLFVRMMWAKMNEEEEA